jgi:hypothetical protein
MRRMSALGGQIERGVVPVWGRGLSTDPARSPPAYRQVADPHPVALEHSFMAVKSRPPDRSDWLLNYAYRSPGDEASVRVDATMAK